jgi:hypothetical protein
MRRTYASFTRADTFSGFWMEKAPKKEKKQDELRMFIISSGATDGTTECSVCGYEVPLRTDKTVKRHSIGISAEVADECSGGELSKAHLERTKDVGKPKFVEYFRVTLECEFDTIEEAQAVMDLISKGRTNVVTRKITRFGNYAALVEQRKLKRTNIEG